ncbi:hypothetical protein [Streptomyces xanthochromogenes]|uniref:hypothetical protein n=1 Tax=Streptomyces xanthochromogenes TaxID=67384 RepID=UPI002F4103E5
MPSPKFQERAVMVPLVSVDRSVRPTVRPETAASKAAVGPLPVLPPQAPAAHASSQVLKSAS